VLEAEALSQWLYAAMWRAELAVETFETRHVRNAFKIVRAKTDRKDARGIAELMRLGGSGRCIAGRWRTRRRATDRTRTGAEGASAN
jgi:hypothetical protein